MVVNGITVTLGLTLVQCSISLVAGTHAAQIAIAAAVCASLSDVVAARDRVARRVLAAGVASIVSGTLFLAIRPHDQLLLPGLVLIVFFSMLLLAWGAKAGSVSFAAALSLVFSMSLPATETITWERFTWGLATIVAAMVFMLVIGIRNAWDLAVWIPLQERNPDRKVANTSSVTPGQANQASKTEH